MHKCVVRDSRSADAKGRGLNVRMTDHGSRFSKGMQMKLGFIGLGVMGRPMALNLLKNGHRLSIYARRPESAAALIAAGAQRLDSPAAVAAHADVIFTMVTASSDLEKVALGENGVVHGARAGSV